MITRAQLDARKGNTMTTQMEEDFLEGDEPHKSMHEALREYMARQGAAVLAGLAFLALAQLQEVHEC
jgi:hypothetical protein